jgi:DNA-binding LacI/PurR family transcriptional regulator
MPTIETTKPQTKVGDIATQIRELARRKGPDAKLPTTRELRDTFGTNLSTVNEALDQLETSNIIYRKDRSGIFVSPRINQKSIMVLLDSSFFRDAGVSPFWGILWGHISRLAEERADGLGEAHHIHMVNTTGSDRPESNELPEDTARWLERGRVDVVVGIGIHEAAQEQLERLGIPCVTFGAHGEPQVVVDVAYEFHLAISSLQEQECRRIGFWMPAVPFRVYHPPIEEDTSETVLFRREMDQLGAGYDRDLIRYGNDELQKDEICYETAQQQGLRVAAEVFGQPRDTWPDGIIIGDDMMTAGALRQMQVLGLRPGIDVKIASHANRGSSVLFGYDDEITLVEFDPMEIARTLFATAEALIARAPVESVIPVRPALRTPTASGK